MTFAAVLLPLDFAFWDGTPIFGLVRFIPPSFFQISLVVLFLVNALLIDVFLVWRTREDLRVRPGARFLRLSLGSVPLLGFYAINYWQSILARKPPWAVHDAVSAPQKTVSTHFYRAAAQVLVRSRTLSFSMLLWLQAGNILFLVALSAKLTELRLQGIAEFGIYAFQVGLHIVVCCCLADYLRDFVRQHVVLGWQRLLLGLLPLFALPLPFPFALASVGAVAFFETGDERKRTLVWRTRSHGNDIERFAAVPHSDAGSAAGWFGRGLSRSDDSR